MIYFLSEDKAVKRMLSSVVGFCYKCMQEESHYNADISYISSSKDHQISSARYSFIPRFLCFIKNDIKIPEVDIYFHPSPPNISFCCTWSKSPLSVVICKIIAPVASRLIFKRNARGSKCRCIQ